MIVEYMITAWEQCSLYVEIRKNDVIDCKPVLNLNEVIVLATALNITRNAVNYLCLEKIGKSNFKNKKLSMILLKMLLVFGGSAPHLKYFVYDSLFLKSPNTIPLI